jgi:hypothetical protein
LPGFDWPQSAREKPPTPRWYGGSNKKRVSKHVVEAI